MPYPDPRGRFKPGGGLNIDVTLQLTVREQETEQIKRKLLNLKISLKNTYTDAIKNRTLVHISNTLKNKLVLEQLLEEEIKWHSFVNRLYSHCGSV